MSWNWNSAWFWRRDSASPTRLPRSAAAPTDVREPQNQANKAERKLLRGQGQPLLLYCPRPLPSVCPDENKSRHKRREKGFMSMAFVRKRGLLADASHGFCWPRLASISCGGGTQGEGTLLGLVGWPLLGLPPSGGERRRLVSPSQAVRRFCGAGFRLWSAFCGRSRGAEINRTGVEFLWLLECPNRLPRLRKVAPTGGRGGQ